MLWHSLYTWLVSDFGLGGTLFLMGCFGFLLSLGWRRCLDRQGVIWLTMAYMMLILFYYTPANNQLFQIGETTSAFAMALVWLILSGERLFIGAAIDQVSAATRRASHCARAGAAGPEDRWPAA